VHKIVSPHDVHKCIFYYVNVTPIPKISNAVSIKLILLMAFILLSLMDIYIYIGKSVPLQAWSGPEGSRKLRFPDYMTRAQDGGKVVSLTQRPPLPPGNAPGTHFC